MRTIARDAENESRKKTFAFFLLDEVMYNPLAELN